MTGRYIVAWLWLTIFAGTAGAAVQVTVDRTEISINDSLNLARLQAPIALATVTWTAAPAVPAKMVSHNQATMYLPVIPSILLALLLAQL